MRGKEEKHFPIDLLREITAICAEERVSIPTKAIIDKHHALGQCVSYSRYVSAFGSMENFIAQFNAHGHIRLPEELSLFNSY